MLYTLWYNFVIHECWTFKVELYTYFALWNASSCYSKSVIQIKYIISRAQSEHSWKEIPGLSRTCANVPELFRPGSIIFSTFKDFLVFSRLVATLMRMDTRNVSQMKYEEAPKAASRLGYKPRDKVRLNSKLYSKIDKMSKTSTCG